MVHCADFHTRAVEWQTLGFHFTQTRWRSQWWIPQSPLSDHSGRHEPALYGPPVHDCSAAQHCRCIFRAVETAGTLFIEIAAAHDSFQRKHQAAGLPHCLLLSMLRGRAKYNVLIRSTQGHASGGSYSRCRGTRLRPSWYKQHNMFANLRAPFVVADSETIVLDDFLSTRSMCYSCARANGALTITSRKQLVVFELWLWASGPCH